MHALARRSAQLSSPFPVFLQSASQGVRERRDGWPAYDALLCFVVRCCCAVLLLTGLYPALPWPPSAILALFPLTNRAFGACTPSVWPGRVR